MLLHSVSTTFAIVVRPGVKPGFFLPCISCPACGVRFSPSHLSYRPLFRLFSGLLGLFVSGFAGELSERAIFVAQLSKRGGLIYDLLRN